MKYAVIEKDYISGEEKKIFETEDKSEANEFSCEKYAKSLSNEIQYVVVKEE